jgi:fucose 4-O-acetylase-like acetyltransferase
MKLEWVLIAKGLGIVLVVAGHFWPADSPAYWTEVRRVIYTFHMPLFFFLSGWLYEYGKYSYRDLMYAKTRVFCKRRGFSCTWRRIGCAEG